MTDVINNKNRGHWIHGGVRVSVRSKSKSKEI